MKARLSTMCGVCGWAPVRLNDMDPNPLGPIFCPNPKCAEFKRQYEPPTIELTPVHAKGNR